VHFLFLGDGGAPKPRRALGNLPPTPPSLQGSHELMIPQRTMRSSVARTSEQLDPRSRGSQQIYHRPNQPRQVFTSYSHSAAVHFR